MHKKLSESEPYPPSEDTFFLADYIKNEKGECALEIGTGSGYLAALLEKSFSLVVATDLVFNVLKKHEYLTINNVCCNGADAINLQFDLVITAKFKEIYRSGRTNFSSGIISFISNE